MVGSCWSSGAIGVSGVVVGEVVDVESTSMLVEWTVTEED
jgi:hypothetical protein